jgi:hypothetical protein
MVWINKIFDPLKITSLKTLFIYQYNKYGADKMWMLDQYAISKVIPHFNRFWTDIFQNWGKLRERSSHSIRMNRKCSVFHLLFYLKGWAKLR